MTRILVCALVALALTACSKPSVEAQVVAEAVEVSPATYVEETSEERQLREAIVACAQDPALHIPGVQFSDADMAELWGGRVWIQEISNPELRGEYEQAYALFAARSDIASKTLLRLVNARARDAAPARARTAEELLGSQYSTEHIDDMQLDPEWTHALVSAEQQWTAAQGTIAGMDPIVRKAAALAIEGSIYNDPMAEACGLRLFQSLPHDDVDASALRGLLAGGDREDMGQ